MICASCAASTVTEPCSECSASPLLDGRYRIDGGLGTGASGATWRATRLVDGVTVAIKERPLRDAESNELARREARVLSELSHPAIPAFIEEVTTGVGKGRTSWLVEEFIEGDTLAAEVARRRFTDAEVLAVVDELLGVLEYLHALRPAVLHRDIKPANVVRDRAGRLHLVDFGSVRDKPADPQLGGRTVTGTFGFMAPECFAGEASVRSDVYGVGVLAIALLSRRDPASLHTADGRFEWRPHVDAKPMIAAYLGRLTTADPARRPDATEARTQLGVLRSQAERGAVVGPAREVHRPPARPPVLPDAPLTREAERVSDAELHQLPDVERYRLPPLRQRAAPPALALGLLFGFGTIGPVAVIYIMTTGGSMIPISDDRITHGPIVEALQNDPALQACAVSYRAIHAGHGDQALVVSVRYDLDGVESAWTYWGGPPYNGLFVDSMVNRCFAEAAADVVLPELVDTRLYYMARFSAPRTDP